MQALEVKQKNELELLSFWLNNQLYSFDLEYVQEVIVYGDLATIPGDNPDVLGILNLRNIAITILDLKRLLNLDVLDSDSNSSQNIIILKVDDTLIGFAVDKIHFTFRCMNEDIDPIYSLKVSLNPSELENPNHVVGTVYRQKQLYILLDAPNLLNLVPGLTYTSGIQTLESGQMSANL